MVKNLKSGALLIFLFILSVNSFGQKQSDQLDIIAEKFTRYLDLFPREEIYVHTDRNEFISGEDLWFGLYLFDRKSFKLSPESRIAYFEILNEENRPVVQKRIKLENGFGPGQITLPDTLSSGRYIIRAYTNWMKNFLPENCFIKKLNIYNYLNGSSFKANSSFSAKSVKTSGIKTLQNLPAPGLRIEIDKKDPRNLVLKFIADRDFLFREGGIYYLFVQTHGTINFRSSLTLSDENAQVTIPRDLLIPGINHFTLFNDSGKPVRELYTYTPSGQNGMLVLTSPESAKIREKISLDIRLTNLPVSPGTFQNLSISVAPSNSIVFPGIADFMIFGSEFGIIPEEIFNSSHNQFSGNLTDNFLAGIKSNWIDWNVIMSGNYPVLKYKKETENHYIYGQLINKNSQIPDPDRYLFISMPGKNAFFRYARTDKNGDFTFTIPIDGTIKDLIIQPEEVGRNNNIKIESSFSEKYPDLNTSSETYFPELPGRTSKLAINYQVMKIYRSEDLPGKSVPPLTTGASKRFYGKPDIELVMDNYIKLPVMQEVFFELMPGVFLKKKKTEYEISIVDPVENKIYDNPPVLFIDGVVVNDPAVIANLDPELIVKIDAVKSRYFVGNYLFYGLVNVITRAGDFSNVTLPDYAVRLPYRVTEPVKSFSPPDYSRQENRQNRIPDFRNTLYWNPSLRPEEEGKTVVDFWTSDYRSDFEINIQGITGEGKLISYRKIIKVK